MTAKHFAHMLIPLVPIFAVPRALAINPTDTTNPAVANYMRPLSFESNQGQTDKRVDFLARGTGYSLFLSQAEAVIVLQRGAPAKRDSHSRPTPGSSATVRMRPAGGNTSAKVDALGELPGKSNYFVGSVPERWHTGISNYAKVRYREVYPGVDMIYYGNQRQLEYDFVVSAGADPSRISLGFQSASKAELDPEGGVVMHTAAGDLRWHKPIAYQEVDGRRKLVACAYMRSGTDRLGFTVGTYDRSKPLIIDPVLEYSTYLGGSGDDSGVRITVDAHGNAYVTGLVTSADFPVKNAFQNSGGHAFVTKFDTFGNLVYSTYLGGTTGLNGDVGAGIAVDAQGHGYVTGSTDSSDFPTKNAFQNTLRASNGNAFVTKLDRDGDSLVYSTYLGGSGGIIVNQAAGDVGSGIAVDSAGHAYVTGYASSPDFPTKNAFQNTLKGAVAVENAFVTKFEADGKSLIYSTYLGGSGSIVVDGFASGGGDDGYGIAIDVHGNAYVTGSTLSSDFPTKNAFQDHLQAKCSLCSNAFVTKLSADGDSLIYSTYLGGSGSDRGYDIAIGVHGNAYVTGSTASPDFPTKNAFQKTLKNSNGNAFVTKLCPAGNALVYSTYLGGSSGVRFVSDSGNGIAVDTRGQAYVTGRTSSTDFPTKNAFQKTLGGGQGDTDAFVTKLCPAGTLVYSSYLGGSAAEDGHGIAVDVHGEAYVTGATFSTDFPTKNAFQPMLGGPLAFENAFVTKISAH
jgi:hypothetical protein